MRRVLHCVSPCVFNAAGKSCNSTGIAFHRSARPVRYTHAAPEKNAPNDGLTFSDVNRDKTIFNSPDFGYFNLFIYFCLELREQRDTFAAD